MEIIVIMLLGCFIAWLFTKAQCLGNCFGCLFFIVICAVLVTITGVGAGM